MKWPEVVGDSNFRNVTKHAVYLYCIFYSFVGSRKNMHSTSLVFPIVKKPGAGRTRKSQNMPSTLDTCPLDFNNLFFYI